MLTRGQRRYLQIHGLEAIMAKAFILVLFLTAFLTACGQPLDGYQVNDLVILLAGTPINPGTYDSCELAENTVAEVISVRLEIYGSTHHEERLNINPWQADSFSCAGRGDITTGFVYGSSASVYKP